MAHNICAASVRTNVMGHRYIWLFSNLKTKTLFNRLLHKIFGKLVVGLLFDKPFGVCRICNGTNNL